MRGDRMKYVAGFALLAGIWTTQSWAGAWPQEIGHIQVLSRVELARATHAYDANGHADVELDEWEEKTASVYIDYGLSERLSLSAKINFQDYRTELDSFSGLGSVEIGARYAFWRSDNTVLSLGASAEGLGKGRRNAFEDGRDDSTDFEVRGYLGHGFTIGSALAFADVQIARRHRTEDADQWRADVTLGVSPNAKWMFLAQGFTGRTDRENGFEAHWVNGELSAVRGFGTDNDLKLQLALRRTLYGKNVPQVEAASITLWKDF